MSFITDHVCRLDSKLDQSQLAESILSSSPSSPGPSPGPDGQHQLHDLENVEVDAFRANQLRLAIERLSTASSSRVILDASKILNTLDQAQLLNHVSTAFPRPEDNRVSLRELELQWLVVGKATVQMYGLILSVLLAETVPLDDCIRYWDDVLRSSNATRLYSVQVFPKQAWVWSSSLFYKTLQNFGSFPKIRSTWFKNQDPAGKQWAKYYDVVKKSIRRFFLLNTYSQTVLPLAAYQSQVKQKQICLKMLRDMGAVGLGVIMNEGLHFEINDENIRPTTDSTVDDSEECKSVVSKSIALIDMVIQSVTSVEIGPTEFEETVFSGVEDDSESVRYQGNSDWLFARPAQLAERIRKILSVRLPAHQLASRNNITRHGIPSPFVRYWLPAVVLALCSGTMFRILIDRKAQLLRWVQDAGTTVVDFWYNWVVEPLRKILGTIRHDEDSEIALMSKGSLEGDKASLERMVLDFATDNSPTGSPISAVEIAEIRSKVKEGDLTPVLRAYENDLRKPFIGAISGNLFRALLIQIQKTKVDVELAIGGIDALLKSQELVFGFVGLTPGVLVCLAVFRWLSSVVRGHRRGGNDGDPLQRMRCLRNIDRILSTSVPSSGGVLSYKDHGLLLCEIHVLRGQAQRILPKKLFIEFSEELSDLMNLRAGIERQLRIIDRIYWSYNKWLCL